MNSVAKTNTALVISNYQSTLSMVPLAVVGANNKCVTIDEGAMVKTMMQVLSQALLNGKLNLKATETLAEVPDLGKYDEPSGGQGITEEQRIFAYRLSRARPVVENALVFWLHVGEYFTPKFQNILTVPKT